jgi:hypothetical protein
MTRYPQELAGMKVCPYAAGQCASMAMRGTLRADRYLQVGTDGLIIAGFACSVKQHDSIWAPDAPSGRDDVKEEEGDCRQAVADGASAADWPERILVRGRAVRPLSAAHTGALLTPVTPHRRSAAARALSH